MIKRCNALYRYNVMLLVGWLVGNGIVRRVLYIQYIYNTNCVGGGSWW